MSRMFELSFEVANLTDAAERAIDEEFDAVVSVHGATTKVMILVPGSSAVNAAESVISTLNGVGLRVVRLMDDLVTRGEIAKRANVTTQAVGLWTRGQRNGGVPFPEPYIRTGNATLWLWGEVATYLQDVGMELDGSVTYPTREEILTIAGMLAPAYSVG